jgi:hypothetical protein
MSSTWCMVPQPFDVRGNRSYLEFWVVTGDLRYAGYKTPTEESLHIHHLIRQLPGHLQSMSFPKMLMIRGSCSLIGVISVQS